MRKSIFTAFVFLLFACGVQAQVINQFINTSANPTYVGDTASPIPVKFYKNASTPSTPLITATFSYSNQQFASSEGNPFTRGSSFGSNTISGSTANDNLSPNEPVYDLMNAISTPLDNMFTATKSNASGTGISVASNRAVALYNTADALINSAGVSAYPLNAKVYFSDLTITFSQPVNNPMLHIVGMGGQFFYQTNGTVFYNIGYSTELVLTSGQTMTKRSSNASMALLGDTIRNISNRYGVNSQGATINGIVRNAASGTIQVNGEGITSITFKVFLKGDGGDITNASGSPVSATLGNVNKWTTQNGFTPNTGGASGIINSFNGDKYLIGISYSECPEITTPSTNQFVCQGSNGANITVNSNSNSTNSIRFVRFSSDQMLGSTPTVGEIAAIYAGTTFNDITPTGAAAPYVATLTAATSNMSALAAGTYYYYAISNPTNIVDCKPVQEIVVTIKGCASLGNYVWSDLNGNGTNDEPASAGISGVKVYLLNASSVIIDSTVTAADGSYLFDTLNSGTYFVKFPTTVGGNGLTTQTSTAATDNNSDANKTTGISPAVVLNAIGSGQAKNNTTIDAGYVPLGSIGNYVWLDTNKDGLQNEAPSNGINGVKVFLYTAGPDGIQGNGDDVKKDSVITANDGSGNPGYYLFDSLLSGNYYVKFPTTNAGNVLTGANGFNQTDGNSDANFVTGNSPIVTINAAGTGQDKDNTTIDAGYKVPLAGSSSNVSGSVFHDFNCNGTKQQNDILQSGIRVEAYDENCNLVAFTTTDGSTAPNYNLQLPAGKYRIEFKIDNTAGSCATSPNDFSSPNGSAYGSNVQFITAPTSTANYAMAASSDNNCCADTQNIRVFVPQQINGNPLAAGTVASQPAFWGYNYYSNTLGVDYETTDQMATNAQLGTLYGVGASKQSGKLFSSAYMKRGAGYGPLGSGGIYGLKPAGASFTVSQLVDLDAIGIRTRAATGAVAYGQGTSYNITTSGSTQTITYLGPIDPLTGKPQGLGVIGTNVERGLQPNVASVYDPAAYDQAGKVGIGDIEMSDNGKFLFVTNLYDRKIYRLELNDPFNPTSVIATKSFALPNVAAPNGVLRPFALSYHNGDLYVGATATAENGGTAADMASHVFKIPMVDSVSPSFNASPVFTNALNYTKGGTSWASPGGDRWNPWRNDNTGVSAYTSNGYSYPTPMLTDIDFSDRGDLILSYRDRSGDQQGYGQKLSLSAAGVAGDVFYVSGGDMLIAGKNCSSNNLSIENAGKVTTNNGQLLTGANSQEFFYDAFGVHAETKQGATAVVSGSNQVIATSLDPWQYIAGGTVRHNLNTGAEVASSQYQIYSGPLATALGNGKGNGLGDIEVLGCIQPIEIGNRIWRDNNGDGIQCATDTAAGVPTGTLVTLRSPGINGIYGDGDDQTWTTTTNAKGEYYFKDLAGGDNRNPTMSAALKNTILPGYDYRVEVPIPSGSGVTLLNQGTNDAVDNDATKLGAIAILPVNTQQTNHNYDVGFKQTGSLGNFVWNDANGDGLQNDGPTSGINGVKVYLYKEVGGLPVLVDSAITANDPVTGNPGAYKFTELSSGNYQVGFPTIVGGKPLTTQNPAATTDGNSDANTSTGLSPFVTIDANGTGQARDNTTIDAGYRELGSIGNYVWVDKNGDGLQNEPASEGVNGVKVFLYKETSPGVFTKIDSAITANDPITGNPGAYKFINVPNGNYKVQFPTTIKNNLPFTTQTATAQTDGNSDPDATGFSPVVVINTALGGQNKDNTTIDAGYAAGSISNFVWNDANNNGLQDDGVTSGINGVKIFLQKETSPGSGTYVVVDSTISTNDPVTGNSGYYKFDYLPTANYKVQFPTAIGASSLTPTSNQAPTTDGNSDALPATGLSGVVPINALGTGLAKDNNTIDAGYNPFGSIGNFVWQDNNGNGMQDDGPTSGIAGVKVYLLNASQQIIDSAITTSTGAYLFPNLPSGDYYVKFPTTDINGNPLTSQNPANQVDGNSDANVSTGISPKITIVANGTGQNKDNTTVDAGYVPYATLGNYVWYDDNGNGLQDEPTTNGINGVKVYLKKETSPSSGVYTIVDSVLTANNPVTGAPGYYVFDSLLTANYKVQFPTAVSGNSLTPIVNQATTTDNNSDANTTTGESGVIPINATGTGLSKNNPTIDAGYLPLGTIGNTVWKDDNGDGVNNEPVSNGINGVKVYLRDAATNAIIDSTITANDPISGLPGYYLFNSVKKGNYIVQFPTTVSGSNLSTQTPTAGIDNNSDPNTTTGLTNSISMDPKLGGVNKNNPTIDAGYAPKGSIGNYVWFDDNRDGQQNEPPSNGINGVTVQLKDAVTGTVLATTTTANDGSGNPGYYTFNNLPTGNYIVVFPKKLGDSAQLTPVLNTSTTTNGNNDADATTGASVSISINAAGTGVAKDNPTIDAGYWRPASIGNRVWLDTDKDGIQDAGEVGVAGITVTLFNADYEIVGSTVTDAYGNYKFEGLIPGQYAVTFTPPSNYQISPPIGKGDNGNDANSDADTTYGFFYGTTPLFTLSGGEYDSTVDCGIYLPSPKTAVVGNYVWNDEDGNGVQDPNEKGISGVPVTLFDATGKVVATVITDADGKYLFTNVPPGNGYTVQFGQPIGYEPTTQTGGISNPTNSDMNPLTLKTAPFNVAAGDSILTVDAGFTKADPNKAALGNRVWYDNDNDGIQDVGETGVAGVKVYLKNGSGTIIDSTQTDALGEYVFNNLNPGTYSVLFAPSSLPAGYTFTPKDQGTNDAIDGDASAIGQTGNYTLVAGERNMTVDAGVRNATNNNSLGDKVWLDANKDGIQDPNEVGVGGVTVTLYDAAGNVVAVTTTDPEGNYRFNGLPDGTYSVGFSNLPSSMGFTTPNASGSTAANNSDVNPSSGRTTPVSLSGGIHKSDVDAGIYPQGKPTLTASLGNRVWFDDNNNGIQDPGEVGVQDVIATLRDAGKDGILGNADDGPSKYMYTDVNGEYLFTDLPAGNYAVEFSLLPAGYNTSPQNATNKKEDSNVPAGLSGTATTPVVALAAGEENLTIDAGIYKANINRIGNYVWYDVNKDGIQDATEIGVKGVQATLLNPDGSFFDSDPVLAGVQPYVTITDKDGYYQFIDLPDGSYKVQFGNYPSGYQLTTPNSTSTSDALDSDADPITNTTQVVTVTGGQSNQTLDAGIYSNTKAALGNYVWVDANADGIQDPTEAPIAGVLVTLYDAVTGNPITTTVTDENGKYLFTNLNPGAYTVGFTNLPEGTEFTTKDASPDLGSDVDPATGKTGIIILPAGTVNLTVDAGVKPILKGGLGNYVWYDDNKDGIQNATEQGVPGVTVTLKDAATGTVVGTAVTDANGKYLFPNLDPAKQYTATFSTLPKDYVFTQNNGPITNATNSDANTTTGATAPASVPVNSINPNVDAGIIKPAASIGDKVWLDNNKDGVQGAGEPGVAGVTVDLYQNGADGLPGTADDILVGSTVTDANGNYKFTDLAPSSGDPKLQYNVGFTPPANYTFTQQVAGAGTDNQNNTNSDANPTPGLTFGRSGSIDLSPSEYDSTIDAGLILPKPPTATVGNYVWFDADGNGTQDPAEKGISGVVVTLKDNTGKVIATTITDANGEYLFKDLAPGTGYTVQFSPPIGYLPTTNTGPLNSETNSDMNPLTLSSVPFNVLAGDSIRYVDAGFIQQPIAKASLGDKVWFDTNNDGKQDPDEAGVSGIKVYLYDAAGTTKLDSTTTDALGNYVFNNLNPGTYVVGFNPTTLPAGTSFTTKNAAGTDSTNDSNADPVTGKSAPVTLAAGDRNMTIDAGIKSTVNTNSIGDYVWYDANKDGIQDATEAPVPGVTVTLYDAAGLPIAVTTTDANGKYLFPNLPNGTYSVGFSNLPEGMGFTKQEGTSGAPAIGAINGSDANSAGRTGTVSLIGNTHNKTLDAGIYPQGSPTLTASLGNKVFYDLDNDGIQDPDETGVKGVTVTLKDAGPDGIAGNGDDGPTRVTTTNGQGEYIFTNLPAGNYVVEFSNLPASYNVSPKDAGTDDAADSDGSPISGGISKTGVVKLAAGEENLTVDLGINRPTPLNTIGNYVWFDVNKDGLQDAAEPPVEGVMVTLLNADGSVYDNDPLTPGVQPKVTATDANGKYLFTDLPDGSYAVKFSNLPAGYEFTTQETTNTATGSDANPATGISNVVAVAGGQTNLTLDAGIFSNAKAALGNYVWIDANGDGIQDPTEKPIAGVLVTLYDGSGNPIATTVTDANGNYLFSNLEPGTYSVGFTNLPDGVVFTTQNADPNTGSDVDPATGKTGLVNLAPGEVNLSLDAGVKPKPTGGLGNYVWYDANNDGIQNTTEKGVPGVTVTLKDATTGAIVGTAVTDGNGYYLFPNLDPTKQYTATFSTLPKDYVFTQNIGPISNATNSDANPTTGVTLAASVPVGGINPNVDAGIYKPLGSIGNYVWLDKDGNGLQNEPASSGINGIKVYLLDGISGAILDSAITANNPVTGAPGYYLFDSLISGSYKVKFPTSLAVPSGSVGLTPSVNTAPQTDGNSDANVTTGESPVVVINTSGTGQDRDNTTIDAGYGPLGSIGNYVWNDANNNGQQDEPSSNGINNVPVKLYKSTNSIVGDGDDVLIATIFTTNDPVTGQPGYYKFDSLVSGNYFVQFPTNFNGATITPTVNNAPKVDDNNDANVTTGNTGMAVINTLLTGQNKDNTTLDAGYVPFGSIGNYVWYDDNGNGLQDEPSTNGINDVVVYLKKETSPGSNIYVIIDSTKTINNPITGKQGYYLFPNLISANYKVQFPVTEPNGNSITGVNFASPQTDGNNDAGANGETPAIAIFAYSIGQNKDNTTIDAGYHPLASVGNYVWYDDNKNGLQDEPLANGINGVTVQLLDGISGAVLKTTVTKNNPFTGASGYYNFDSLPSGNYKIKFPLSIAPSTLITTSNFAIKTDGNSDADVATGITAIIVLDAKGKDLQKRDTTIDAGYDRITLLSISGINIFAIKYSIFNTIKWSNSNPVNVVKYELFAGSSVNALIKINTVNANTGNSYLYNHNNINLGYTYYMVRSIDANGLIVNSQIVFINRTLETNVVIYPNPIANGSANVNISGMQGQLTGRLFDIKGRLIKVDLLQNGHNVIDVNNIRSGAYNLAIYENGKLNTVKQLIIAQ
jgi:hypothetical protein